MTPGQLILFHSSEVTSGDVVRTQLIGPINEPAEFQMLIAHYTGIGCTAGLVFISKVPNHMFLEILSLINEVIADAEGVADRTGVTNRLRTAAVVLRAGNTILRPKLERDTDDLVALLLQ